MGVSKGVGNKILPTSAYTTAYTTYIIGFKGIVWDGVGGVGKIPKTTSITIQNSQDTQAMPGYEVYAANLKTVQPPCWRSNHPPHNFTTFTKPVVKLYHSIGNQLPQHR